MAIKELTPEDRLVHKIETLQKQLAMALSEYHAEKAAGSGADGKSDAPPLVWTVDRKPKGRK